MQMDSQIERFGRRHTHCCLSDFLFLSTTAILFFILLLVFTLHRPFLILPPSSLSLSPSPLLLPPSLLPPFALALP